MLRLFLWENILICKIVLFKKLGAYQKVWQTYCFIKMKAYTECLKFTLKIKSLNLILRKSMKNNRQADKQNCV